MSILGFEHTPPKKSGSDSEESSMGWSPKTDFCDSPNSIDINWDFPKPRLSHKIKQDVIALAATMKSAHVKRRRLKKKAFRNSVASKSDGVDKQTSPLSHIRSESRINKKKFIPRSRFDYEELEKIDIGGYVNTISFYPAGHKNNSKGVVASSSSQPDAAINEKPNIKATPLNETDKKRQKPTTDKNAIVNEELPKHVIDQFLNEDINLFLTPELDSW